MWQVSVLLSVTFTVKRLKLQGLLGILYALPLEIVPQLSIKIRSLSCFLASSILLCGEALLSLSPAGKFISKPLGSFCLGTSVAWLLFFCNFRQRLWLAKRCKMPILLSKHHERKCWYSPNYSLSPRANRFQVLVAFEDCEGRVTHFDAVELVVNFAFAHVVMFGNIWHIHLFPKSLLYRRREGERDW